MFISDINYKTFFFPHIVLLWFQIHSYTGLTFSETLGMMVLLALPEFCRSCQ